MRALSEKMGINIQSEDFLSSRLSYAISSRGRTFESAFFIYALS